MPFGPAQDPALHGRVGALVLHATHDPQETTAAARKVFRESFLTQVDPDGVLSESERLRRAEYARKAFYARMALASSRARSKSAKKKQTAELAPDSAAASDVLTGGGDRVSDRQLESS